MIRAGILIAMLVLPAAAQVGLQRKTADELLEKGDAYHAMGMYRNLLRDTPNDPELHYNLGNALYKMQLWDEAIQAYQKAQSLTSDESMKNYIQYNISNCLYKKQQLQESIEGYKQTLRKNPADRDARLNLELALKQMQKENSPQSDSNRNDPNRQNEQDEKKDDPSDKNKDNGSRQEPRSNDETGRDQQTAKNQPLSRKDAERILDALKDKEKELQKKRVLENLRAQERTTKDW